MPPIVRSIINFVAFQVGWFACVVGAARGWPLAGPAAVLAIALLHLMLYRCPRRDIPLFIAAGVMGWLADSALVLAGLLDFPEHARLGGPSTIWMAMMWVNFATVINASLGWLRGRPLLAAAFGLTGGPAAYWAGATLGAVTLPSGAVSGLIAVGVEWALAMPILLVMSSWIATRIDRTPIARSDSLPEHTS
jgi:hypothetical protein